LYILRLGAEQSLLLASSFMMRLCTWSDSVGSPFAKKRARTYTIVKTTDSSRLEPKDGGGAGERGRKRSRVQPEHARVRLRQR